MFKSFVKKLPGIRGLVSQRDESIVALEAESAQRRRLAVELEEHDQRAAEESRVWAEQVEQMQAELARRESGVPIETVQAQRDELDRLRAEKLELQVELKGQRARARGVTEELAQERELKRELKRTVSEGSKQLAALESDLVGARGAVAELTEELSGSTTRINELIEELDSVQAGLEATSTPVDIEAGETRIDEATAELDTVRRQARRSRQALNVERGRVQELREEVAREREAKREIRQRVMARGWKPGYARNPDYQATRDRFFEHCVERGGLKPDGRVLDVGCGIGGVAERLINYLDETGSYVGFDVDNRAIKVANENVAPYHPGFTFELADVWNSKYNPDGAFKPHEYTFPYSDDDFDLVILRSVFTHMLPDEVDNYLGQIARILRPGGRALITYFLLDDETLRLIEAGEDDYFKHDYGVYRLYDPEIPEAAVALDVGWVRERYADKGLAVAEPILYGSWRTPDAESLDGQDLITAEKPVG